MVYTPHRFNKLMRNESIKDLDPHVQVRDNTFYFMDLKDPLFALKIWKNVFF